MGSSAGDAILRRLMEICGPQFARPGGSADAIAGTEPRWVAAPPHTQGAAEVLRLAARDGLSVTARGAGSKIDWGVPPAGLDLLVDIGRLAGLRRHAEPDLLVEAGAGTPLRAVQTVLAGVGRRLAIDPPSEGPTIGGVLAADETGPLRHRWGSPREQVLDVRCVTLDGDLLQLSGDAFRAFGDAGGFPRDVPGVPPGLLGGFPRRPARLAGCADPLPGLITSATLRVLPRPGARLWVTRTLASPSEARDLVLGIRSSAVHPDAVEMDLPAGRPAGIPRQRGTRDSAGTLAILLEGDPAPVGVRAAVLVDLLGGDATPASVPPPWWGRAPFADGEVGLRIDVPPTDLHAAVYSLRDAVGAPVPVRGRAGVGVIHAALPGTLTPARVSAILDALRGILLARDGTCTVLAAPAPVRAAVNPCGP
ncbi:FAD-binding oxidoreductase [Catenuloplanes atrovinosus]|uniref:Glycolate oxidase FAD binding subunit n=1 Tax=Catenuloplanes atrovinosus TaxID=137266 RepID=A0AAE4CCY7_9ACTN|nr:FAD-binding oxidoreductase [Catenuloplanes atrovinosus]MDR7279762.1 glycolate oxidase FAD binding subunit [Catenuloplanes atrovinosus]